MKTRAEFLKRLRESPGYREVMGRARNAEERKKLAAAAEQFIAPFADLLGPLIARAEADPEFAKQLGRDLVEGKGVLSTSEPEVSGSTG